MCGLVLASSDGLVVGRGFVACCSITLLQLLLVRIGTGPSQVVLWAQPLVAPFGFTRLARPWKSVRAPSRLASKLQC